MAQSRRWCFTVNNPKGAALPDLVQASEYVIIGQETAPTTGTPHLQGYAFLKKKTRLLGVKKLLPPGAHLEPAVADHQKNREYCSKSGSFVEHGIFPSEPAEAGKAYWSGVIASAKAHTLENTHPQEFVRYYSFAQKMERDNPEKLDDNPELDNYWIWGPSGCGKSSSARQRFPDFFNKPLNKWWCGYQDQETVLLDDFGPQRKELGYHLKIWADHYPFFAEVKNGGRMVRPKRIVITSQYSPDQIYADEPETLEAIKRRYKIERMGPPPVHIYFTELDGRRSLVQ